jgi:CHASE3 domain sensor protein
MELTFVILDCRSVGDGQDVLETLEGVCGRIQAEVEAGKPEFEYRVSKPLRCVSEAISSEDEGSSMVPNADPASQTVVEDPRLVIFGEGNR